MFSYYSIFLFYQIFILYIHGWGFVGHRIVARLAERQLTSSVKDWVFHLVSANSTQSLSSIATWADEILFQQTNTTEENDFLWSKQFHYINVPDNTCNYVIERDCDNDICIDGAIRNYTKRLKMEFGYLEQKEALHFLVHFVGDIHQPLHTAFRSDYGGNRVQGRFMNSTRDTNLHSLWDTGIINYRIKHDFFSNETIFSEYMYQFMIRQNPSPNDDDIQQWIKENFDAVCHEIYLDDNLQPMNSSTKFRLGEKYYHRSIRLVEQRLAASGRRLGQLLNRLGKDRMRTNSDGKSVSMTVIIFLAVYLMFLTIVIVFVSIYYIMRRKKF